MPVRVAGLLLPLLIVLADAAPPDPGGINRLIRLLGSPQFAEREAATRALDKAGEPALSALRKAAGSDKDPEIRRRAAMLVERIEDRLLPRRVEAVRLSYL